MVNSIRQRRTIRGARRVGMLLAACLAALLLLVGPVAARTIRGGPAAETLHGTPKGDLILGRSGADHLLGRAGKDRLLGGPGADRISGGPGRDKLRGGPGRDKMSGGHGRDRLLAADGRPDTVNCGPGQDVAIVDSSDRVAASCEVVKRGRGRQAPGQTPTTGPTTPPPRVEAAPAPPAADPVLPGTSEVDPPAIPSAPIAPGDEDDGADPGSGPAVEGEGGEPEGGQAPEPIPVYEERPLAMFPEGHAWTGNGVGTFGDAGPPFVVNNDRSYMIETDGEGDESIATSPPLTPVDLTAAHVSVQGLVSYSDHLGEVRLRLSSGEIETDYAEATLWEGDQDPTVLGTTFEYQSVPTGGFAVHGTVDWSRIDRARQIVTDDGTGSVFFYAAGIYAVPTYRTPTVSFAFDDSLESTFTLAVKKLSAYRMPATEYVIADAIGQPGFLTEAQLYTMSNLDRWEIGGHAATLEDHNAPNGLDSLTPGELKADFDTMREWMAEQGFAQRTFAYPKGAAGVEARRYARRDYCAGRVTADGPETLPPRNPFVIRGFSVNSATTHVADLEREVDRAVAERSWLVLTFHNLATGTPSATTDFNYDEFVALVDHVHALEAQGRLQVRTVADALGC